MAGPSVSAALITGGGSGIGAPIPGTSLTYGFVDPVNKLALLTGAKPRIAVLNAADPASAPSPTATSAARTEIRMSVRVIMAASRGQAS